MFEPNSRSVIVYMWNISDVFCGYEVTIVFQNIAVTIIKCRNFSLYKPTRNKGTLHLIYFDLITIEQKFNHTNAY